MGLFVMQAATIHEWPCRCCCLIACLLLTQEQKAERRHAAFAAPLDVASAGLRDWLAASGAGSIAGALAAGTSTASSGAAGGAAGCFVADSACQEAEGWAGRQPAMTQQSDAAAATAAAAPCGSALPPAAAQPDDAKLPAAATSLAGGSGPAPAETAAAPDAPRDCSSTAADQRVNGSAQHGSKPVETAMDGNDGGSSNLDGRSFLDGEPQHADYVTLAAMKAALRPKFCFLQSGSHGVFMLSWTKVVVQAPPPAMERKQFCFTS